MPSSALEPLPNLPMYMPGRRRICSRQSRVRMASSVYWGEAWFSMSSRDGSSMANFSKMVTGLQKYIKIFTPPKLHRLITEQKHTAGCGSMHGGVGCGVICGCVRSGAAYGRSLTNNNLADSCTTAFNVHAGSESSRVNSAASEVIILSGSCGITFNGYRVKAGGG